MYFRAGRGVVKNFHGTRARAHKITSGFRESESRRVCTGTAYNSRVSMKVEKKKKNVETAR